MASTVFVDRFRKSGIGRQTLMVTVLVIAIATITGAIWLFAIRTPYQPLFNDMRINDAATVVAELDRLKMPYKLAQGGQTILVPADKVDASRLSILSKDLPLKGGVGFELFNKSDMGLTDFAQKINYQRALQGELARTIMSLDGVDTARVHLSLGEDRIFRDDRVPPKASVIIRMQEGRGLPSTATAGIQRLVAAAVPQLQIDDVVVLDERGSAISAATALDTPRSLSPALLERRSIEQYYEARVRLALERIFPGKTMTVAVWANIAPRDVEVTSQDKPWYPAGRAFPITVAIDAAWSSGSEIQSQLHDAIAQAVDLDATLGDRIQFGPLPKSEPAGIERRDAPVPAYLPQSAPKSAVAPPTKDSWNWIVFPALIVSLLILCLVLLRRQRMGGVLTPQQRLDFAEGLRSELVQGDDHATS